MSSPYNTMGARGQYVKHIQHSMTASGTICQAYTTLWVLGYNMSNIYNNLAGIGQRVKHIQHYGCQGDNMSSLYNTMGAGGQNVKHIE